MELIHQITEGSVTTFVLRDDRGVHQLRIRDERTQLKLEHGETTGGHGPDDEREIVVEAFAFAVGLLTGGRPPVSHFPFELVA